MQQTEPGPPGRPRPRTSDLASGASASFVIAYDVDAGIPDGTVKTNTATVTKAAADTELAGDLANNTDTEDTLIGKRVDRLKRNGESWLITKRTLYITQSVLLATNLSFIV